MAEHEEKARDIFPQTKLAILIQFIHKEKQRGGDR